MLSQIKNKLKKTRLLPVLVFIAYTFSVQNLRNFLIALFRYLYNNVLTFLPIHSIRVFYLRYFLNIKIGKSSFIHMGARFEGKIVIGRNSVIGRKCILIGNITIKNNVSITAEAYIFTISHLVNDPDFKCFYTEVILEDHSWIGARAIIQPGVQIGKGAVLGSGAIATKSIPDYTIYAGVPAKQIGERNKEINYELNYSPYFQ